MSCDVTADQSGVPIGPSSRGGTKTIPGPAPCLGLARTCAVAATFAAAPFCRGLNVRRSSGRSGYRRLQLSLGIPVLVSVSARGEALSEQGGCRGAAEGGGRGLGSGSGPLLEAARRHLPARRLRAEPDRSGKRGQPEARPHASFRSSRPFPSSAALVGRAAALRSLGVR